jgi:hypothetical protein
MRGTREPHIRVNDGIDIVGRDVCGSCSKQEWREKEMTRAGKRRG